nr:hypothetical protein [Tanacetum cinerariifolium]
MGCLPRSACLGSLSLTQSPNSLVLGEGLEIQDNHIWYILSKVVFEYVTIHLEVWPVGLGYLNGAIREYLGDSEWSRPAGVKLARENLQSRVKEEDSITNSEGHNFNASRPSRLCAQAQLVDDMPFHCGPIESAVKHLFGGVVRAMMSSDGSIVASLENVNGFLAVNTPPDDLIRTNFEQEGVVSKIMLHIFEEFVLLLGRYSLNNEIPHTIVCKVGKPWGT